MGSSRGAGVVMRVSGVMTGSGTTAPEVAVVMAAKDRVKLCAKFEGVVGRIRWWFRVWTRRMVVVDRKLFCAMCRRKVFDISGHRSFSIQVDNRE